MADLGVSWGLYETGERLRRELVAKLGYASQTDETGPVSRAFSGSQVP